MPAPPLFRDRLVATLTRLLPRMVDRIWDASEAAQKRLAEVIEPPSPDDTPADERKKLEARRRRDEAVTAIADTAAQAVVKSSKFHPRRRQQPKLRSGAAREAVHTAIKMHALNGISRAEIQKVMRHLLDGREMSPNTLKRALSDLRDAGAIFTLNSRWYPSESEALPRGGKFPTTPRPPDIKGYSRE